jgi:hypothetical protein
VLRFIFFSRGSKINRFFVFPITLQLLRCCRESLPSICDKKSDAVATYYVGNIGYQQRCYWGVSFTHCSVFNDLSMLTRSPFHRSGVLL